MGKKGSLFQLIKSLTRSEKRYFRLSAVSSKADANYMQLFDVIDSQEQYDEAAIREHFAGQAFTKQLHVAKIYLAELIMKALRNYHSGSTVNAQLLDLLRDIEQLFSRELYDNCWYRIIKAEQLANAYEKKALLIEVLAWKRRLLLARAGQDATEVNDLLDKERTAINQLAELNGYWTSTMNMFSVPLDKATVRKMTAAKPQTLQAVTLQHHLLYSWYFMNGQTAQAEKAISDLIAAQEQQPLRIEDDPSSYVTAIGNKISILLHQKRWREIEELIAGMRAVPARYRLTNESKFTIRLWLRIFNLELELYRDARRPDKGIALIGEVETFIDKHSSLVPDNYRIMLYYQMAGIYLLKDRFNDALSWINKIINYGFEETRNDLQCYARLLNLLVHFELDNILVLRYAVDSSRRFFKKKKWNSPFATIALALFSRLSQAAPGDYRSIFKASYEAISGLSYTEKNNALDYIDMEGWLGKKIKLKG